MTINEPDPTGLPFPTSVPDGGVYGEGGTYTGGGGGGGGGPITADQIIDATRIGLALIRAANEATARDAIDALDVAGVDARIVAYFAANPAVGLVEHGNTRMMPVWDGVGAHPTRPAGLPDGFYVLWRQPFAPTVGTNYARLGDEWKVV